MLNLQLRDEFRGKRLSGTTVDFTNSRKTGALQVSAEEFLKITYPSFDLLKTIEATGPDKARPVVIIGSKGQGKSHLLAALYHLYRDGSTARDWLNGWSDRLNRPEIASLKLHGDRLVIAESLHQQRYKFLWDILFEKHPRGEWYKGRWEQAGTAVPGTDLMVEMLTESPTLLILDEFQTWFEGLTNTKQYPWRNWAFNFIQILSEIAQKQPELLVLVVSVLDGNSEAYQQIRRVNPLNVDFKGPDAKRDRRRLLLYRLFENRMQIPPEDIRRLVQTHASEYFRLAQIPQQDHEKHWDDFVEAWPFAPHLLRLLDDQVLIATDAQEARDLIRILVDVFKTHDPADPVITAADFSLTNDKSGVVSLIDSVANQRYRDLREKAVRNLEAVCQAVPQPDKAVPHAEEILSSLWLRSLTFDRIAGAQPAELQVDITGAAPIDDNQFEEELARIVDNSFNIHQVGGRLLFKSEENARSKLLAHARNDKLFADGQDVDQLAKEIRAVLAGPEDVSGKFRLVVLKHNWETDPWSDFEEKDQPKEWDNRQPIVVVPTYPEKPEATLGKWLKDHLQKDRNTIRFLLPPKETRHVFYDRELLVLARAVHLAKTWKENDRAYGDLERTFRKEELVPKLKTRFDRLFVLTEWNYAEPAKCRFDEERIAAVGEKIPEEIDRLVREQMFIPEDFEEYVLLLAKENESVGRLLNDLKEPRPGGKPCIPWLGETAIKERVIGICAEGKIAINVRSHDMLQAKPDELHQDAWNRMKGKLGTGKHLDETILLLPDAVSVSGGKHAEPTPLDPNGEPAEPEFRLVPSPGEPPEQPGEPEIENPFQPPDGDGEDKPRPKTPLATERPTSSLNLLGQVETWKIGPATPVSEVQLKMDKMTGAQLQALLKRLPDGVTYGLELQREDDA